MKAVLGRAALCLLAPCAGLVGATKLRLRSVANGGAADVHASGARESPIGKVVGLLEEMLKKSGEEQTSDDEAHAKFKCYCDDNTGEKAKTIEDATKAIGLLENQIGGLQGENGATSTEAAELKQAMGENEQAVETAKELRGKELEEFTKFDADMTQSIPMLEQAISVLGEIGADQTLADSQAHEQFMGGFNSSLVGLDSTVKKALAAATALEAHGLQIPKKWSRLAALLQGKAPLGTTYESQSGEIVGILRQMKETFEENLQEAKDAEAAALKAHEAFAGTKKDEFEKLEKAYNDGQDVLSENDGSLSDKKTELGAEVEAKADAEDFLVKLEPMCSDKAKEYQERRLFRTNEQAAISKAVALLNSDAAFKTFSKVTATSGGGSAASLVQLSARRHGAAAADSARAAAAAAASRVGVERVLFRATRATKSARLARVAAALAAGNPFDKVIAEIENMKTLIGEEAELDLKQKTWCEGEQSSNEEALSEKQSAVATLKDTEIPELEDSIDNPDTGFKASISQKEEALEQNAASMKEETSMRREENADYQVLATNAAEARELLEKAIAMLQKYYAEVSEGFLQKRKEDPAPPATWESGTMGTETEGNAVITELKFILTQTETEEQTAHQTEAEAQAAYETSMSDLKQTETDLQEEMAGLHELLAEAEEKLVKKRAELEQTEREAIAIERYLEQINPGCEWIKANYDAREGFRSEETAALDKAVELITATPAYASAKANEKYEKYGECKDVCIEEGDGHAKCLACNAKVSVPGYCAGHAGTPGC